MTYGADWRFPRGINPRWQRHSLIDTGMPTKQQMAMELCEHLLESLADLRKATRATEVTTRRALRIVEAGGDVAAGLAVAAPSATRQNMNDAPRGCREGTSRREAPGLRRRARRGDDHRRAGQSVRVLAPARPRGMPGRPGSELRWRAERSMRPTLRNIFVGASFEGRHGGIALCGTGGSGPLAPEWANTSGKGSDTPPEPTRLAGCRRLRPVGCRLVPSSSLVRSLQVDWRRSVAVRSSDSRG